MSNPISPVVKVELPAPDIQDAPAKNSYILTGPEDPYFELAPQIALRLLAYKASTQLEFSGVGFVRKEGKKLYVYDFVLLNVGSYGYTEIPPEKVAQLAASREDAANMRVWLHRHPLGTGKPGPHNWSGTDEATCTTEPLGSPSALTKWAAAIVLTPGGWVGRIDSFQGGLKTRHLRVEPDLAAFALDIDALRPVTRIQPSGRPFSARSKKDAGGAGTNWNNSRLSGWSETTPRYSDPEPHRYSDPFGNFTVPAPGARFADEADYRQDALLDAASYADDAFFDDPYAEEILLDLLDTFGPSATLSSVLAAHGYDVISDEPTYRAHKEDLEPQHGVLYPLARFFNLGKRRKP